MICAMHGVEVSRNCGECEVCSRARFIEDDRDRYRRALEKILFHCHQNDVRYIIASEALRLHDSQERKLP